MMENILTEELFEKLKNNLNREILAIYLTGSHLNNLNTWKSDVDFIVVVAPSFEEVVSGNYTGQQLDLVDAKVYNMFNFINLLRKSNPNMLEIIYKEPLYSSEGFEVVAKHLYEKRHSVATIHVDRLMSSCLGMMKQNYKRLKYENEKNGKALVNFHKAYYQFMALNDNKGLEHSIKYSGYDRVLMLEMKKKEYSDFDVDVERENVAIMIEECVEIKKSKSYKDSYFQGVTEYKPLVWLDLLKVVRAAYLEII